MLYKWLVLPHLADIKTYPKNKLKRLEAGAWVGAFKDGKRVALARDEFHERTASNDIQLVMPKQLTTKNMQVLIQYVTYGATARNNLINQFLPEANELESFKLSKGCTKTWINFQESQMSTFRKMLATEYPFTVKNRILLKSQGIP